MLSDLEELENCFPWFVSRMVTDTWLFGLLVTGNLVFVVNHIEGIWEEHGDIVWLDVEMSTETELYLQKPLPPGLTLMFSPTHRTRASLRADAVIAAFELADT